MNPRTRITSLVIFSFLLASTLSCSAPTNSSGAPAPAAESPPVPVATPPLYRENYSVALEEVSSEGCLNVEAYFGILRSLWEELPAQDMSVGFEARHGGRRNFTLLLAYGAFTFDRVPIKTVSEIMKVRQNGCQSVAFVSVSGAEETYKIKSFTTDTIELEREEGDGYFYRWLSPTSFEMRSNYKASDYFCSEEVTATVKVTKRISWGPMDLQYVPFVEEGEIDQDYISLVAESVGVPVEALYVDGSVPEPTPTPTPEPTPEVTPTPSPQPSPEPSPQVRPPRFVETAPRKFSSDKLTSLSTMPPRQELYNCD